MLVKVEKASIEHLDKLYEIEIKCFETEAFTKQQLAYLLTDTNSVGLVSWVEHEIVGFAVGKMCVDEKSATGHILTVDVSPEYRRKGLGLRLLQEIERIFKEKGVELCCLEAQEDNVAALKLYQKSGYKEIVRLKNYYGKADGIRFRKVLT